MLVLVLFTEMPVITAESPNMNMDNKSVRISSLVRMYGEFTPTTMFYICTELFDQNYFQTIILTRRNQFTKDKKKHFATEHNSISFSDVIIHTGMLI